jgi:hypothetical protein
MGSPEVEVLVDVLADADDIDVDGDVIAVVPLSVSSAVPPPSSPGHATRRKARPKEGRRRMPVHITVGLDRP